MDELRRELEHAAGAENVLADPDRRAAYGRDESSAAAGLPDLVVRPAHADAVARVLAVAHRRRLPVVPAGGRTGLSGGAVADGGIVLSLERLDGLGEVDRGNLRVTVGAGVRTIGVQRAALAAGLFYPPDPAALDRSTIGGNIATNAGGPRCFKYGVTAEYVLALEAATADGRLFRTGAATRKNTAGLRLAQLLVGSEGTLAVVTEATLRLVPAPRARLAAALSFASAEAAGEAVAAIVRAGLVPSALELLDELCVELVELGRGPVVLLVEVDGADEEGVRRDLERVAAVAGATAVEPALEEDAVERLWAARRSLSAALTRAAHGWLFQDVCVPTAAIPEAIRRLHAIAERTGLRIPVFCHAGDGNLHPSVLYEEGEQERALAAEREVLRVALELGGTISAEHGVGLLKLPYLQEELDPVALEQMQRLKRALDPHGILNPGKAVPD